MQCHTTKRMENAINKILILLVLMVLYLSGGCSKQKKGIIQNKWKVESIRVHADSTLLFPVNVYIVSFDNSRKYSLKLDVNSCSGNVRLNGKNKINFGDAGCTYICCDSMIAEKLLKLLVEVDYYEMNDSLLVLKGDDGEIINLKKM